VLGFPRIGVRRELKNALEAHWRGALDDAGLEQVAADLRARHWRQQQAAGISHIPSNDFSLYDQVLDAALTVGAVPARFASLSGNARRFACARGTTTAVPLEMTKWFDTNYHYLVPEIGPDTVFRLDDNKPLREFREAAALGIRTRPVLLGPVSLLLLVKSTVPDFRPLAALSRLLPVYADLLGQLAQAGAEWVQLDEPCLVTDLDAEARDAYVRAYAALGASTGPLKLLLATYFGGLDDNLALACNLPVQGLHLDLVRAPQQLDQALDLAPARLVLSLGVVDGRNVWACDRHAARTLVERALARRTPETLWVASSCSLLHTPVDLREETALPSTLRDRLAFAVQKLDEIAIIARGELGTERRRRHANATLAYARLDRASAYPRRAAIQQQRLHLPLLPTTTIGSFPQTADIRRLRADWRAGRITDDLYRTGIRDAIRTAVRWQEDLGLDVLVHGEFERTDMVEFFADFLDGVAVSTNGWVQSYGSRCVKPPIIHDDVRRRRPMTVDETVYAQSLTAKPMKGMLTGPVTILQWSFVRDDLPRATVCRQIAAALRDEVLDLEQAGIAIIQVDEPAFREGLPLRQRDRATYLLWAVECFRIATASVRDDTQIHTHMCYSKFSDILEHIERLDADVLSIETARSRMELLDAFAQRGYPLSIGPGVWDIHSPRVPGRDEMAELLRQALRVVPATRLWANPDCGLKTREWAQVEPALEHLVAAARMVRAECDRAAGARGSA
jgi:5-methyltetrahydropteroyltriglutamate--homocysteine methyltransferase